MQIANVHLCNAFNSIIDCRWIKEMQYFLLAMIRLDGGIWLEAEQNLKLILFHCSNVLSFSLANHHVGMDSEKSKAGWLALECVWLQFVSVERNQADILSYCLLSVVVTLTNKVDFSEDPCKIEQTPNMEQCTLWLIVQVPQQFVKCSPICFTLYLCDCLRTFYIYISYNKLNRCA